MKHVSRRKSATTSIQHIKLSRRCPVCEGVLYTPRTDREAHTIHCLNCAWQPHPHTRAIYHSRQAPVIRALATDFLQKRVGKRA